MIGRIPPVLFVAVGGTLGAVSRYFTSNLFQSNQPLPVGTLIVNVIGSFLLGALVTLFHKGIINQSWIIFAGIGFLGSYTTMATFAIETISLSEESFNLAFRNFLLMIFLVFFSAASGKSVTLLIIK